MFNIYSYVSNFVHMYHVRSYDTGENSEILKLLVTRRSFVPTRIHKSLPGAVTLVYSADTKNRKGSTRLH